MPHVSAAEHHKGFQQVRCSSAHFHFVWQRESLYHWLASESLAWSFFYGPSFPECTIFTGAHDNRAVVDKVDGGWWGIWGGGEQMSKSIYSEGTPRGHRGLWNTLQWLDEIVICVSMCVCVGLFGKWPWPQFPPVATTNRNRDAMVSGLQLKTHFLSFLLLSGVFVDYLWKSIFFLSVIWYKFDIEHLCCKSSQHLTKVFFIQIKGTVWVN